MLIGWFVKCVNSLGTSLVGFRTTNLLPFRSYLLNKIIIIKKKELSFQFVLAAFYFLMNPKYISIPACISILLGGH